MSDVKLSRFEIGAAIALDIAAVVVAVAAINWCRAHNDDGSSGRSQPAVDPDCWLRLEAAGVPAATSEQAYKAVTKAVVAADDVGIDLLPGCHQAVLTPNPTCARVLESDQLSYEVRILDGGYNRLAVVVASDADH